MDYRNRSANTNRWVNQPKFISGVASRVSKNMKRPITSGERQYIVTFIRNLDPNLIAGKPLSAISSTIADVMAEKLKMLVCEPDEIDTHELLKDQIGVSLETDVMGESTSVESPTDVISMFKQTSPRGIQKYFNPRALHTWNYFLLDSRYRVLDNDGTTFFSWDHVNNVNRSQGSVNTVGNIRDIIQIKVYPIRIPYAAGADNDMRRITALFDEFSAQSFVGQENRRFHTMFESKVDGDFIDLDPQYQNDGIYRFAKPVTQFNSITLTFASPLEKVVFDTDRLSSDITYGSPLTTITTVANHNLSNGHRVYISSYTTTNPDQDSSVIASINTSHIVDNVTGTTFTIPFDSSSINSGLSGTVSVTNGSLDVVGTGTLFGSEMKIGDTIRITDGGFVDRTFTVLSITNNTNLVLTTAYTGATEGGLLAYHDNRVTGLSFTTFFDSKRFIVPIELMFITPVDT
jgi:hypothetical protein